MELNERHGSQLKSERLRIKAAGGRIAPDGSVYGVLFPTRGWVLWWKHPTLHAN